jgi:ribonucleoside-diphosphate reductase alpha chain
MAGSKLALTENQRKVIKDKYLRDAPSVESWLMGVAQNIALAEILLDTRAASWGVFKGVSVSVENAPSPRGLPPSRAYLFHQSLPDSSARDANFERLLSNLRSAVDRFSAARALHEKWSGRFYELMSSWRFLPNSPTLMNAGRELQQLSACYVLPVPDSMEGINAALSAQSLIQKSGGGTGFAFSRLRPKGSMVKKTRGVASGAVSFMRLFDTMTEVVKQGGTRRGANMGVLHYTHPEILDFVSLKSRPGVMENFNLSVAVDARFMELVAADGSYDLLDPRTGEAAGSLRARAVFDAIAEQAWRTGDPGLVVLDRINASGSNPTPALGQIESTNPCGEQPLLPWEPCNLGSINLSLFVKGELTKGKFDFAGFRRVVADAARFLDDVIEVNNYPLPEIEALAKRNRRVGLGVMGYAEALVKAGLPYDSPEALAFAETLMSSLNAAALEASEDLARERGVYPSWKGSIDDPDSPHFRGEKRLPRHCARTTIAPTGTIALAAGLQGSGIEPFFGIGYTRQNAKALDAAKKGLAPDPEDIYIEVNPLFRDIAKASDHFGLSEEELWERVIKAGGSVQEIPEVPPAIKALFKTAHDVSPEYHIRAAAAFQKHTDNGVSKTINLPASASVSEVADAYTLAYQLGLKGITVYRDGSKAQQVLTLAPAPSRAKRPDQQEVMGARSDYYMIRTGYGPLHVHINFDERGPYQIFTNLPPLGTEISGLTALIGILLSKYLAEGGDPVRILKHLNSVKGDRPLGLGPKRVDSIAHAVALALRQHLEDHGWLSGERARQAQEALARLPAAEYCPRCRSRNVSHESGCAGPTCHDCGYAECS